MNILTDMKRIAAIMHGLLNTSVGRQLYATAFILVFVFCSGCGIYSFTEGSIPAEVRTISIPNFPNESGGGPPTLPLTFSEKLRSYYQQNTNLIPVRENGDWKLQGRIETYNVVPVAPTENETAGLNRLTIGVKVKFTNTKDEKANFEQLFTFYADFRQEQSLSQVEGPLIEEITNQIVIDIFTRTTSNW